MNNRWEGKVSSLDDLKIYGDYLEDKYINTDLYREYLLRLELSLPKSDNFHGKFSFDRLFLEGNGRGHSASQDYGIANDCGGGGSFCSMTSFIK